MIGAFIFGWFVGGVGATAAILVIAAGRNRWQDIDLAVEIAAEDAYQQGVLDTLHAQELSAGIDSANAYLDGANETADIWQAFNADAYKAGWMAGHQLGYLHGQADTEAQP